MRVLFCGLGSIGQRHARNLRALLGASVELVAYRVRAETAVIDESKAIDQARDLERSLDLRVIADLGTALKLKPDAVFVCNPTSHHVEIALAAAREGCDLFIEKPLSHTWTDVEALERVVDERGLIVMVGYQFRFHPCLQRLQEMISTGELGQLVAVRSVVGEHLADWHPYEDYRRMYASRRDLGGGVLLSQIHEMDYLSWLFGRPLRLFAVGGHLSRLEVDVEDTASILMEFVHQGRALPVHLHVDYLQRPAVRGCEVIGDAGRVTVDLLRHTLHRSGPDGAVVEVLEPGMQRNDMFLAEMKHFLQCIESRLPPPVSIREARDSLLMALAARRSMATASVVGVE